MGRVRSEGCFGRWQSFAYVHEWLVGIEVAKDRQQFIGRRWCGRLGVTRRQNPPIHRRQVRREHDLGAKCLLDLWRVAVGAHAVCAEVFVDGAERGVLFKSFVSSVIVLPFNVFSVLT